jgi:predicted MFS family arabinose efflux permease
VVLRKNNKEKMDQESFWVYIVAAFGWPLSFYLVFMYFTGPLKVNYGYTPEDVIFHNFLLSIISLIMFILVGVLSYSINPMKILKAKGIVNFAVILFLPFLLMYAKTPIHIFLLQTLLIASALSIMPASPIFLNIYLL